MTDAEFEVLDELYFVEKYNRLKSNTGKSDQELISVLESLYNKGWIRILSSPEIEVPAEQVDLPKFAKEYFYLASKSGLFAHNS